MCEKQAAVKMRKFRGSQNHFSIHVHAIHVNANNIFQYNFHLSCLVVGSQYAHTHELQTLSWYKSVFLQILGLRTIPISRLELPKGSCTRCLPRVTSIIA